MPSASAAWLCCAAFALEELNSGKVPGPEPDRRGELLRTRSIEPEPMRTGEIVRFDVDDYDAAVARLRKDHPSLCLIALTGDSDPELHRAVSEAGADGVLLKGQMISVLLDRLNAMRSPEGAHRGLPRPDSPETSTRCVPVAAFTRISWASQRLAL